MKPSATVTLELKNIVKTFILRKKGKNISTIKSISSYFFNQTVNNKDANTFVALRDINLKFYENEIVGIIGSNGAGKSTLTSLMYGLTEPSAGEIITNNRVTALFGFGSCMNIELTGRQNIYLTCAAYGLKKNQIEEYMNDIIGFSEIKEIDIQIKFYSNGMLARLGFSIIAFIDTDILILDESLVGGDIFFQKKCVLKIKDIASKPNKTIILISHERSFLNDLCDKIIVMESGQVVYESDPVSALAFYEKTI